MIPAVDNRTVPAVDNRTIPAVDNRMIPAVDNRSIPAVDNIDGILQLFSIYHALISSPFKSVYFCSFLAMAL